MNLPPEPSPSATRKHRMLLLATTAVLVIVPLVLGTLRILNMI